MTIILLTLACAATAIIGDMIVGLYRLSSRRRR